MGFDRITKINIKGMRCLEDVTLDLKGLTVLIGENGSGKSTIVEAIELLRKASRPGPYISEWLRGAHGGLDAMLRCGVGRLEIEIGVGGEGEDLLYRAVFAAPAGYDSVESEALDRFVAGKGIRVLKRNPDFFSMGENGVDLSGMIGYEAAPEMLALPNAAYTGPRSILRMLSALKGIGLHVSFDTRPLWIQNDLKQRESVRLPNPVEDASSLNAVGSNLPSCFHTLRNAGYEVWTHALESCRLGMGDGFQDIVLPSKQKGSIGLEVKFAGIPSPISVVSLSEGQIAFLAFVAMYELLLLKKDRSLIVIDEPELHLHPNMLARVVGMLEEMAEICPVIVATHSERFLDCLSNPAESVVLCELDENRATRLLRPDPEKLKEWLTDYRGIGHLRSEGYEAQVFKREV